MNLVSSKALHDLVLLHSEPVRCALHFTFAQTLTSNTGKSCLALNKMKKNMAPPMTLAPMRCFNAGR